jgi:O-Antigen ligase
MATSIRQLRKPREGPASTPLLKPYLDDPNSRPRRRARRTLFIAVTAFCFLYGLIYALFTPNLLLLIVTPVVVLMGFVVWALPDVDRAPTRVMEGLFFAFIVALIIWPNYLAFSLPGLPWITLLRLVGFPMTGALLICVSTSKEFRERLGAALDAAPNIWKLLVAFIVIQAISIVFSETKGDSISKFFVAQVNWTAIFFISCFVFLRAKRVEQWAMLLWLLTIPVGLIAIAEYRARHVLWAGHIPGFLKIEDDAVLRILSGKERGYTGVWRAQSTFSISMGLAEYISLTTPFAIHFAVLSNRLAIRALAIASIPFLFLVVYLTGARLGMVGFGLSFLGYFLIWAALKWRRDPQAIFASAVLFGYPVMFGAVLGATLFFHRLHVMVWGGGQHQDSTNARVTQYITGIPKVFSHPWGYGIGRSAETLGFYQPGGLLTIDTYYLSVALEYGILGFVVYYGTIVLSIYNASRWSLKANPDDRDATFLIPAAISLLNFLVIKSIYSQQDSHSLAYMLMGMIVALVFRIRKSVEPGSLSTT